MLLHVFTCVRHGESVFTGCNDQNGDFDAGQFLCDIISEHAEASSGHHCRRSKGRKKRAVIELPWYLSTGKGKPARYQVGIAIKIAHPAAEPKYRRKEDDQVTKGR